MSKYKVYLGGLARTLLYEDSEGIVRFGFDFDTSENPNILILERPGSILSQKEPTPDEQLRTTESARINLAFERTKQHLLAKGHRVKVWPDEYQAG
jgi:hypothetical protein